MERAVQDIADQERIRQEEVRDNGNPLIDLLSLAQTHLLSS